jgi:predicted O-methyltransferase YrrM
MLTNIYRGLHFSMTENKLNFKQKMTQRVHYLKDKLGLPVNYTDFEFSAFKESLEWSQIPHDRVSVLSTVFVTSLTQVQHYVDEAEEILIEEKNERAPDAFKGVGNPMGKTDRITLYAAVRTSKPKVVIETGTAAGASATYILEALEKNGEGCLYSVDVAHKDGVIGRLIPDRLRSRVHIRTGDSLSVLPELLNEVGGVDFFLHDSLHTYAHMMGEYEIVYRYLNEGGVVCSHDVLMTNAWKRFTTQHGLHNRGMVKNLGICRIEKKVGYGT